MCLHPTVHLLQYENCQTLPSVTTPVTYCQVLHIAKCYTLPSVTHCQVLNIAKCYTLPSVTGKRIVTQCQGLDCQVKLYQQVLKPV